MYVLLCQVFREIFAKDSRNRKKPEKISMATPMVRVDRVSVEAGARRRTVRQNS
jgi:hypothetical protein